MSRLEKTIQKKHKNKKIRFISKIVFMLCMAINLMICIIIVDNSAKQMLGEKTFTISSIIGNIKENIDFNNIGEIKDNIIKNFNK
ncbi:hypothetical protein [Faecalimicrobium dakarense]|uniref:hypothetical protein n=1 Tax=Faecalimicrobium dakarense TaxID=1301100 RepID=UPI0004B4CD93|nr:hypothetical protein [[Clostridium] dakarense]